MAFYASTVLAQGNEPIFEDISKQSGLNFVHFNGMSGKYYYPEMVGAGCAFLDYDNDGDLDVYLVQGSMLGPGKTFSQALFPPTDSLPRDRLFRNDLTISENGERTVHFVDVTDQAGIKMTGYGMGVATGDINNDGYIDLYVTNFRSNHMLLNKGDGTFTDITKSSGAGDSSWGTSAAFFDYDRDGWLDLYVTNYVVYDISLDKKCYQPGGRQDYCGPSSFKPQPDRLYRNRGDATFEEVTLKVLDAYQPGPGLGVISTDVNGDGWMDIYVANDGEYNQLWINEKGKIFRDDALFSGTAVNLDGKAEASMGVSVGDFDGDGDEDIFLTHLMEETNTLYVNNGKGFYEDRTIATGLSSASIPFTAFGAGWIDYDNDGWMDLITVNGSVKVIDRLALKNDLFPLRQPNQFFRNEAGKRFVDITGLVGKDFALSEVSRGTAFGDVDNDGDTDILIANNNGPVRLLRNNRGQDSRWLGLRLVDPEAGRDQLGAKVVLKRKNLPPLWRWVRTDGSYCSGNDPRILFGLGEKDDLAEVEITWPDGTKEVWKEPVPMRYTTIKKGDCSACQVPSSGFTVKGPRPPY